MNKKFLDKNLKTDKSLYESVCIPLRITIGFIFLTNMVPQNFHIMVAILFILVALGMAYKLQISGSSWKNYSRAIITYLIIAGLILWNTRYNTLDVKNTNMIIGMLLILDALAGMQTKFIFNKLS